MLYRKLRGETGEYSAHSTLNASCCLSDFIYVHLSACPSVPVSRSAHGQTERDQEMEKEAEGDRKVYRGLDLSLVWLMILRVKMRPRATALLLSLRELTSYSSLVRLNNLHLIRGRHMLFGKQNGNKQWLCSHRQSSCREAEVRPMDLSVQPSITVI